MAIRLDQLGFEKTEKRGKKQRNTLRRISVGTGKHELITTIMSRGDTMKMFREIAKSKPTL